jgi:hypothetical protein
MKYRTDFVTNSSSSSFVIAIHKNLTTEILAKLIYDDKYMNCTLEYAEKVADEIFNHLNYEDMDLGDWKVFTQFDLHDGGDEYTSYSILCKLKSEYIKGKRE